jgi:hypothetical protein
LDIYNLVVLVVPVDKPSCGFKSRETATNGEIFLVDQSVEKTPDIDSPSTTEIAARELKRVLSTGKNRLLN